jgi:hypothetical protein
MRQHQIWRHIDGEAARKPLGDQVSIQKEEQDFPRLPDDRSGCRRQLSIERVSTDFSRKIPKWPSCELKSGPADGETDRGRRLPEVVRGLKRVLPSERATVSIQP